MKDGLVLCLLLSAVVVPSFFWKPRIWLRDFPKDIQDMVDPMTRAEKRVAGIVGVFIVAIMLALIVASTLRFGFDNGYLVAALHAYLLFQLFNLFDMVIIDWGILLAINPAKPPIPGTENAEGWRDFGFHAMKSAKGVLLGLPFA
ncbi:MAG: hypothetical protein AAF583_14150, partial [Pseudomonadota bacterium]